MMQGFPPVLLQMARDRRLRPTDMRVYLIACQYLDFEVYRPLKAFAVAHEMGVDVRNAQRSLRNLARLGYLQRADKKTVSGATGSHAYRLPFSQRAAESTPNGASKPSTRVG